MRNSLLYFFILVVLFSSCEKEYEAKLEYPPDNFQPVSAHSIWTYSEFPGNNTYSVTLTGWDSTFNQHVYKELFSNASGYYWFRKNNGSYYMLYPVGPEKQEYLYLKDNAALGEQWEFTHNISGFATRFYHRIIEKDITRLVNGVVYEHVITVKRDTWVNFGAGNDSLMRTENFSYANDVGLILVDKGDDYVYLSQAKIR